MNLTPGWEWRFVSVLIIAFLAAALVAASARKFLAHRSQKAVFESLSEHDPRCIGDGAVQKWGTAQAKYPEIPKYRAGMI